MRQDKLPSPDAFSLAPAANVCSRIVTVPTNYPATSVQNILMDALAIEDAQQRRSYVEQACGADAALRREIEELLAVEAVAGEFLPEAPVNGTRAVAIRALIEASAAGTARFPWRTNIVGDRIGRYELLQEIGEGGSGIVYLAQQLEPVRRQVALKVIKCGMDTRQVVARFESERQTLALMDHPNIARVLDAGETELGRPYFVMELVRGLKITDYCDRQALSTRQRLELFVQVCQGVQHAHQKGIIHRDLKPPNILVAEIDRAPLPKVIDFGIAKATHGGLEDQTQFTAQGQFLGTPAYVSPEQAGPFSADIDTRSDIYSLGVLLYELLTGKTPFDTKMLTAAGLDELRRTIRQRDPVRPSTRLRSLAGEELDTVASQRRTDPNKLAQLVCGDLDWIVMRCLAKERAHRYATAAELAQDIRRHLEHQPVLARPPSRLYAFQKTVRRHQVGFAAALAILVVLIAGVLGSTFEALRARRAEQEQARFRAAAQDAEKQQRQLRQRAEAEAQRADLAETDVNQKLRGSYLAQAQAGRWSQRAGRRFEGLELLRKAAAIRPGIELRNEAIACMTLTDLRTVSEVRTSPDASLGSFDGAYEHYAYGDGQGTIHVRSAQDSHDIKALPGFAVPFAIVQLSPDGQLLFAAGGTNFEQTVLLEWRTGETILRESGSRYRSAIFSADSQLMAIAYDSHHSYPIRVLDRRGQQLASFNHGSLPYFMRFNPRNPRRLLVSDWTETVRLWNWPEGKVLQTLQHPSWVQGIDWHPNGRLAATVCGDNKVRIWDVDVGQTQLTLGEHEAPAVEATFSAQGDYLATRGWEGFIRVWDPWKKRELVHQPIFGFMADRFSRRANQLGFISGPGALGVLEVCNGIGYRALHNDALQAGAGKCDFSPDGQWLVATHSAVVQVWNVRTGEAVVQVPCPESDGVALFQPKANQLWWASSKGIEPWQPPGWREGASNGLRIGRQGNWGAWVDAAQLSPDGRWLTVRSDQALMVCDPRAGQVVRRLNFATNGAFAVMSPDAQLAACWTRFSTNVEIWDISSAKRVVTLPAHPSIFAAFSPNNEWFVAADEAEVRAWDCRTWQTVYTVPRKNAAFYGFLGFSPDSRLLAVAITRTTLQLLEPRSGRELATLEAPEPGGIHGVTFSPDSCQLAVATGLGAIQVWDLPAIRQELAAMGLDWE